MNQFEIACDEVDGNYDGTLEGENVIEWIKDNKTATVCFTQKKFINKIKKLQKKFPDKVEICHEQNNVIVAHIPVSAVRLNIIIPREMSEEEKEIARARLLKAREASEQNKEAEEDEDIEDLEENEE